MELEGSLTTRFVMKKNLVASQQGRNLESSHPWCLVACYTKSFCLSTLQAVARV